MTLPRIPYTRPSITYLESSCAECAVHGLSTGSHSDYLRQFESAFASHLGVPYAIATSSCTGALHLGLAALGIGQGDEVILADTNWIATAAPVCHLGASPIFVDILPDSWCIDPTAVELAITPRTHAIIVTHLYGNLCDMARLLDIGDRHGIPVIEDAAEALGSVYYGARAGSLGKFGVFSFHGSKTITTGGEGGMFVTSDPDLYERVLTLSNHGRTRQQTRQFFPDILGYKFKMSNLQAAVGCAQLSRIDRLVARKQEILRYYRERLGGLPGVHLNPEPAGTSNGAWMPTVVFSPATGVTREQLLAAFLAADIDARVFFYPLSSLPPFAYCAADCQLSNPVAYSIPARAINLPSYHDMTQAEQDRVIGVVRGCLEGAA
jgi:perosamine synthetase